MTRTHLVTRHTRVLLFRVLQALLQAEAEHEQLKAARATGARFIPGVGLVFNPFLVLKVQRSHLLQETLAQVCIFSVCMYGTVWYVDMHVISVVVPGT